MHSVRSAPRMRTRALPVTALAALFLGGPMANSAQAIASVPPLGTAASFSVLARSAVNNTGISTIAQDLGVSTGSSLPATVGANAMNSLGTRHAADAAALQAKSDLDTAYTHAANQTVAIAQDTELGGETKVGGTYTAPTTAGMGLAGELTLDGANHPDSIWVFQAGRALDVASSGSVRLIRGANPCNVFWQVSGTATLGANSRMIGTIMAETSVVMQNSATLQGRILARNAQITMDTNVITNPLCRPVALPTPTTPPPGAPGGGGAGDSDNIGGPGGGGGAGDDDDNGGPRGPGGGGGAGDDDRNGGPGGGGGAGDDDRKGGPGGGGGAGDNNRDEGVQVTPIPSGAVDTGVAAQTTGSDRAVLTGSALAASAGALALVAVRRRRSM